MPIQATVENGKITSYGTEAATSTDDKNKKTDKKQDAYDKEMFLQLLVAEMQYQDPLEPTSNTEYVSELASFSQIEAVQAVQDQMKTLEANSLVGKNVIMLVNSESGEGNYVTGRVDYVMKDDEGNMKLSIGDKLYSIDDLQSIADDTYFEAITVTDAFFAMVNKLPNVSNLTADDEKGIVAARTLVDGMTAYQKQFVNEDAYKKLQALEARLEEIKKIQGNAGNTSTESTENADNDNSGTDTSEASQA